MSLFDINVGLGRVTSSRGGFDTAEPLLTEMRRLRIDEALVYHELAAEADIELGNGLLLEAIRGHEALHACWVMAPPALGDLPEPAAWVRQAVEAGVRAVRLFPRHGLYTLREWCAGPLLAALERAELPLLLDFGPRHWSERVTPWEGIREACERHPGLSVVVIGSTVGETRDAVALLRLLPNLSLEYHAFNVPDGLRLLAEAGLAGQLVFGTGMPARAGECVTEQTLRSGLGAADLHAVGAGNARRVLNLTGLAPVARASLEPVSRASGMVVDAHAHVGCWERTLTTVRAPADIVTSMQRCGVQKMVVSSFAAIHGETRAGNQQTADAIREFPEHLYGYAVVNPHYPEETEDELRRCFDRLNHFVGLKLHCGLHGVPLQHAGYERALAFANERELPVLVHGHGTDDWDSTARRYAGASFIMAHGCAWDGVDPSGAELYKPVGDVANLYVDVAGSAAHRGALRALVDLVGARKVLFGSDFPMFDLAFELGRVVLSDLKAAERVAVCGGNALRLFSTIRDLSKALC